jgi:hypothetical protein
MDSGMQQVANSEGDRDLGLGTRFSLEPLLSTVPSSTNRTSAIHVESSRSSFYQRGSIFGSSGRDVAHLRCTDGLMPAAAAVAVTYSYG